MRRIYTSNIYNQREETITDQINKSLIFHISVVGCRNYLNIPLVFVEPFRRTLRVDSRHTLEGADRFLFGHTRVILFKIKTKANHFPRQTLSRVRSCLANPIITQKKRAKIYSQSPCCCRDHTRCIYRSSPSSDGGLDNVLLRTYLAAIVWGFLSRRRLWTINPLFVEQHCTHRCGRRGDFSLNADSSNFW